MVLSRSLVDFKTIQSLQATSPLVIGARHQQKQHQWDGRLDQVAIFTSAINRPLIDALCRQKFSSTRISEYHPVAAWDFDGSPNQFVAFSDTVSPSRSYRCAQSRSVDISDC